jgi:hypothetical protein
MELTSYSATIEAAENGFMVRPPWDSKEKPVIVETLDQAIATQAEMTRAAWDEKTKTFNKMVKESMTESEY